MRPRATTSADGRPMPDGKALDEIIEASEKWARSYRRLEEPEETWKADYEARQAGLIDRLAEQTTAPARPFQARDWILAIVLWLLIAMAVFVFSVVVMSLSGTWTIVFGVFALLIAAVGVVQSYRETTSGPRAAKRLAATRERIEGVGRRAALDLLRERAGAASTGAGR